MQMITLSVFGNTVSNQRCCLVLGGWQSWHRKGRDQNGHWWYHSLSIHIHCWSTP